MKQKILMTLALLITAATGAWAQTQWESGDCTVTLNNGTLTVSGKGAMADYTQSDNRPWHNNRSDITSVVVESGVTSVGKNTFESFTNLTSVTLPEDFTAISPYAFSNCSSLQSITIPSTVTSIGEGAFEGCSAMTSVTLPEGLTAINGMTFSDCSSLTSITIPSTVTSIGTFAFKSCSSLTSITIPSMVTSIGDYAFMSSSAISDVNLYANPDNLTWGNTKMNFKQSKATKCHVLAEHLSAYQNNFSSVNVTFVGDLEPLPTPIEVTTNAAEEGATFTEATFEMPTYDVDVNYELVRDMTVDVTAEVGDGSDGYRIRIKKDGNDFVPVNAEEMLISVSDDLNDQDLTVNTDFTSVVQKKGEGDTWTDLSNEDKLSVGTFRYKVTGVGNYDGTIYSNEFELYQGYEIKVAAGEYVTYYKDEALKVEDENAKLYTITAVEDGKAVLSDASDVMPKNTPFLVHNNGTEEKTILLIPCNEPNLAVTVANEFKGTLEATTIEASTDAQANYVFNGKQFVWVKNALTIGANKAWLSISNSNARTINLVFDETTKITNTNITNLTNGDWYDLNGRKLNGMPTKKGVYILNGKKVVIK